jgi:hypothetical protein
MAAENFSSDEEESSDATEDLPDPSIPFYPKTTFSFTP